MLKSTTGPWHVGTKNGCRVWSENGETLIADADASESLRKEIKKANARLIAAAPDLLAVLKAFSDYVHQEQSATDGAVTYSTTAINHWAFLARAAIAKATGGAV